MINIFDSKFYLYIYPDLKKAGIKTKQNAYAHYLNYGKKEGRVCNKLQLKNNYKMNMDNAIQKIKAFTCIEKIENNIHIIVRTHLRECYFKKNIESILMQNYENYIIHVAYDHIDSFDYISKYINNKIIIHKVERNSDGNGFFDLYCDIIKDKINDGWIMYLDDDNYLIHPNCLKIINMYLKENILVWSFLRPDKLITPNLKKLKYGEIDNCGYIFHYSIKDDSQFGDFYGSDFQFINKLIAKHKTLLIDFTLTSTQYSDKISNNGIYEYIEDDKFIDLNRIDYNDYKNHYKDLQHLSIENLKEHYNKHGKYESRVIKFINFDYHELKNTINNYNTYHISDIRFTLITTLYNESNETRLEEYVICLRHHQKNQFIENIVIFYDNHKGDNEILKKCFKSLSKVEVVECMDRPYFIDMFNYSNQHHHEKNIIICNSDIIFDHTLHKLEHIDFKDKLYALTRWDYIDETTAKPRMQNNMIMHSSKDSWIFKTPFCLDNIENLDKFKEIQLGKWNCDGALNYFLKKQIVYECLNIKSYHVHFCNGRTEKDSVIIY